MNNQTTIPFYNTPHYKPSELKQHSDKAKTQEELVYEYFLTVNKSTALEAAKALGLHESSCRRSVTNLTKQEKLIKTNEQRMGIYGKLNYVYQIFPTPF